MTATRPIFYDSHMHTPLCKHATGEPERYAQTALDRGLAGIVITCHNPLPDRISHAVRMAPEQWDEYVDMVGRARDAYAGRVDVRLGIEADYMPGLEPFLEKQLADDRLHHVLGSIHPFLGVWWERFASDPLAKQRAYFDQLAYVAETGLFDTLSHPDLVKNTTADHWDLDRIMPDICRALDRIARTETAMELNTSGLQKVIPEFNPGAAILEEIRQRDISIVLGSDSHVPQRVGDQFVEALDLLESLGFDSVSFFLERTRQTVTIDDARRSLTAVQET